MGPATVKGRLPEVVTAMAQETAKGRLLEAVTGMVTAFLLEKAKGRDMVQVMAQDTVMAPGL